MRERLFILYNLPFVAAAFLWRRLMRRTTFIAITGSNGKTTAKDILAALLATKHPTVKTAASDNGRRGIPRTLLRVRPRHRFAVVEVGVMAPGHMWRSAWLVRPDIVVVTSVAAEHSENFRSLDQTASEKAKLVRALSPNGLAVLNGDDDRVKAMAKSGPYRSLFFGRSPEFELWAEEVDGDWPGRLRFSVHGREGAYPVVTRLVGRHWIPPVLAALLTARELGVDLKTAAPLVTKQAPHVARLQPVNLPNGAIMLRDEYNGSAGTMGKALEVFSRARARRRIAILSDITDDHRPPEERLGDLGKSVARLADVIVFVGSHSRHGAAGSKAAASADRRVHAFPNPRDAASFLAGELRDGDLALLKGRQADHLSRICLAMLGPVECWKVTCPKRKLCDHCSELGPQSVPMS